MTLKEPRGRTMPGAEKQALSDLLYELTGDVYPPDDETLQKLLTEVAALRELLNVASRLVRSGAYHRYADQYGARLRDAVDAARAVSSQPDIEPDIDL